MWYQKIRPKRFERITTCSRLIKQLKLTTTLPKFGTDAARFESKNM